MARCNSCAFVFFNVLILFGSVAMILLGVAVGHGGISECNKLFQTPVPVESIFWLVASLIGLIGMCGRFGSLVRFYLAIMFVLIIALFATTIFGFVVTHKGPAGELGYTSKEYKLEDFSEWLQKNAVGANQWKTVKGF